MRLRNSIFNLATQNLSILALIAINFFVTPIVLRLVGDNHFGAFRVILDYIGYFTLLEFGIYNVTQFSFNKHASSKEESEILAIFKASTKSYLFIAFFSIAAISLTAPFLHHFFDLGQLDFKLQLTATITMSLFYIALPFNPFAAYLEGTQKSYIVNLANFFQKLASSLFGLGLAYYGMGILGLCLGTVLARLAMGLLVYSFSPVKFSHFKKTTPSLELTGKKQYENRFNLFLFDLSGKINLHSDQMILAAFSDIKAVTNFYLTSRLIQIIGSQVQSVGNSTWAALGELYHSGQYEKFKDQVYRINRIIGLMSCIFLLPLIILNKKFIMLWVGERYYGGDLLTISLALVLYIQSLMSFWGWIFTSTNHSHLFRIPLMINTSINLVASLIFTKTLGIAGPVLGTLSSYFLFSFTDMQVKGRKVFNLSVTRMILSYLPAFLYCALITAIAQKNVFDFEMNNFSQFFYKSILFGIANTSVALLLLVGKADRQYFFQALTRRFKR